MTKEVDLGLYDQANKRIRRMPWQSEAKKDVAACEKLWGVGNERWSRDVRMGKPTRKGTNVWIHRALERTEGIEISQYLEEKKSTEIPLVVTSERGAALKSIRF